VATTSYANLEESYSEHGESLGAWLSCLKRRDPRQVADLRWFGWRET
jgi:hypothetical protein